MRTHFICMIFYTWCKFGDKLVSHPIVVGMAGSVGGKYAPIELHL